MASCLIHSFVLFFFGIISEVFLYIKRMGTVIFISEYTKYIFFKKKKSNQQEVTTLEGWS
jgi:hypothetical protein